MIQKCPKCGMWCVTNKMDLLKKSVSGFLQGKQQATEIGEKVLGKPGKFLAEMYGVTTYWGMLKGGLNAVCGEDCKFICSKCESEWTANEKDDQRKIFIADISTLLNTSNEILEPLNAYKNLCRISYYKSLLVTEGLVLRTDDFKYVPTNIVHDFVRLEELSDCMNALFVQYSSHFLEIPYSQRKFLMLVNHCEHFPKTLKCLHIDKYPKDIIFSNGYPQEHIIYVCHPLRHNYYMPLPDAKFELFKDEVREFMHLMGSLGAKSVHVVDVKEEKNAYLENHSFSGGIGGKYKGVGGNLEGASHSQEKKFGEFREEYKEGRTFNLGKEPCIPNDLLWYKSRLEWQDLANERCNNHTDFKNINKSISTRSQGLVSQSEMQQLSVELNTLVASGNVHGGCEVLQSFFSQKEHTWNLEVEFYPLSAYKKSSLISMMDKLGSIFKR